MDYKSARKQGTAGDMEGSDMLLKTDGFIELFSTHDEHGTKPIADVHGSGKELGRARPESETRANAALIAHHWNTFQNLLVVANWMYDELIRARGEPEESAIPKHYRQALKKANEVEIP